MKKLVKTLLLTAVILTSSNACKVTGVAGSDTLAKICYECMFPMYMGGVPLVQGTLPDPSMDKYTMPTCFCPLPYPRSGLPVSWYNPSRIIETVSDPYCFPSMGINASTGTGLGSGTKSSTGSSSHNTFMQTHYLVFPVAGILEYATDFMCLEAPAIDVAYITEPEPLWNDDQLSAFLQPEAILFGNPISNLACAVDSVSSSSYYPLDPLFWCMGSWGNAYPMTGRKDSSLSFVQDTAGIASKMIYKLHREMILWTESGITALCGKHPLPVWKKTAYRLQITHPVHNPVAVPIGQTGLLWDWGKDLPSTFDNFGYMLFKKKECCAL